MDMTLGQIFEKAVMNTVLGMGTVFAVLIFISLLISLFAFIPRLQAAFSKNKNTGHEITSAQPQAQKPEAQAAAPAAMAEPDDGELAAVIAAAIAAWEGTTPEGLIIRSIKRAGQRRR